VTQHRPEDAAMVAARPAVVPAGDPEGHALCFTIGRGCERAGRRPGLRDRPVPMSFPVPSRL
jgi:hypothetical protein